MSELWRGLCIAILCAIALLSLAARFPALDTISLDLPHPLRSLVATLAVRESTPVAGSLDRALAIDPDNAAAWGRRCTAYMGNDPADRLADCQKAVALKADAANLRGEAAALEENGDPCAAERSYRAAREHGDLFGQRTYVMRDQARAACSAAIPPKASAFLPLPKPSTSPAARTDSPPTVAISPLCTGA